MANVNNLGFGSLASVGWTDLDGTKLSASQLTEVNSTITDNTTISNALLGAISQAVNQGWAAFNLQDLHTFNSTLPASWAEHINLRLGQTVTAGGDLSLGEWRRIAADLQNDAALESSKRDSSDGGGIKAVNGKWFVNGQEVSLLDVYMAVRVNQVSNFDDSLAIFMEELKANNKLVKEANDWLAKLRSIKPTDTSSVVTWNQMINTAGKNVIAQFTSSYGHDPRAYMPTSYQAANTASWTDGNNYLKFETWIEEVKQYVSQKDTENQIAQQKLEQMTNRRSEVLEGLTSFIKSQSQTGQSMSRNLG